MNKIKCCPVLYSCHIGRLIQLELQFYGKLTTSRPFLQWLIYTTAQFNFLASTKHYFAQRKTHWLYHETTTQTLSRNVQFQLHFCWLLHNDSAGAKVTDGGGRSSWSLCSWPCSVVPLLAPALRFVCCSAWLRLYLESTTSTIALQQSSRWKQPLPAPYAIASWHSVQFHHTLKRVTSIPFMFIQL